MKKLTLAISICALNFAAAYANEIEGYSEVPTQEERAKVDSGYVLFPNFPRLELVKEGDGTSDPSLLERVGRDFGYNSEINLAFARAVVKPELESWFNADRSRIQALLKMAGNAQGVQRP